MHRYLERTLFYSKESVAGRHRVENVTPNDAVHRLRGNVRNYEPLRENDGFRDIVCWTTRGDFVAKSSRALRERNIDRCVKCTIGVVQVDHDAFWASRP